MNETIGSRIAALRKQKGLSQEKLAEKLGVSSQAVSKWENDASCPDIPPHGVNALCRELKRIKKTYGEWTLVDVESAAGQEVKIIL